MRAQPADAVGAHSAASRSALGVRLSRCACVARLTTERCYCRDVAAGRMQLRSLIGPAQQRYEGSPVVAELQTMLHRMQDAEASM